MIQLNSQSLNKQPSTVTETIVPIQTDVEAIDGSMQRNFIQDKYAASLKWSKLYPADYLQIMNIIAGSGVVTYYNNLSDEPAAVGNVLQFNGICTFKEVAYEVGNSMIRDLQMTIRQV